MRLTTQRLACMPLQEDADPLTIVAAVSAISLLLLTLPFTLSEGREHQLGFSEDGRLLFDREPVSTEELGRLLGHLAGGDHSILILAPGDLPDERLAEVEGIIYGAGRFKVGIRQTTARAE